MKKAVLILISVAALLAPASALASGAHATPCRTSAPGFVQYLGEIGTSCSTARTVEHYWVLHEILTSTVRVAGIRWSYHRWTSTETSFVAGARVVYVVHRPSS